MLTTRLQRHTMRQVRAMNAVVPSLCLLLTVLRAAVLRDPGWRVDGATTRSTRTQPKP